MTKCVTKSIQSPTQTAMLDTMVARQSCACHELHGHYILLKLLPNW